MRQIHPRIPQDVYELLDSLCAGGVSVSEAVATAVSAYALDMARSMMDQGNTTTSPSPELLDAAEANLAAKSWAHMGHTPPPWVSATRIKAALPALTQPDSWAHLFAYDPLLALSLHRAAMAVDAAVAAVQASQSPSGIKGNSEDNSEP